MKLYFVEASSPIRKTLGPNQNVGDYLPRDLTSSEVDIPDSLDELCTTLNNNRQKALIKGNLKQPLNNESRAGKIDTGSKSQLLVIDIDGIELPNPEAVMHKLQLTGIRYIWHPSSSYGVLDDNGFPVKAGIRGHIFILLSRPLTPIQLKNYLRYLNIKFLNEHLTLTPTSHAIDWIVDPSLAEATRIIFLSDPKVLDPWQDSLEDRPFTIYGTGNDFLDANQLTSTEVINSYGQYAEQFKVLRKNAGLSTRKTFSRDQIIKNPEPNTVTYIGSARGFAYYNVGAGDSASYYHPDDDPSTIRTFKDEPPFDFKAMDARAYNEALERINENIATTQQCRYIVFRDYETDQHYTGRWDIAEDTVELWPTQKTNLEDFMKAHRAPMPDPIPQVLCRFQPHKDHAVQVDNHGKIMAVNLYKHTEFDRTAPDTLIPSYTIETALLGMQTHTPAIIALMFHVYGDSAKVTSWCLNWLAGCVQSRRKPQTALIITGEQGTGKDTLIDLVIEPLFGGARYTFHTTLQELSSSFNRWALDQRLVVVSEARQSDIHSAASGQFSNNFKEWVTQERMMMRQMYRDAVQIDNFSAFILNSNHYDALKLSSADRRFTVSPRQDTPLDKRQTPLAGLYDFRANKAVAYTEMREAIKEEMPLFIKMLQRFDVNWQQVRTPLENQAKKDMAMAARTTFETFVENLTEGNIDFFLDFLQRDESLERANQAINLSLFSLQNGFKDLILSIIPKLNQPVVMSLDHIMLLWIMISGERADRIHPSQFQTRLIRNGVLLRRHLHTVVEQNKNAMGLTVTWRCKDYTPEVIYQMFNQSILDNNANNQNNR